ncbi:MAG: tRNA (N(6)-L-threonylcarbamoyladenosine(37)-C(2))-methylthiotransferase MtaB [Nitrospina sp.]|jgi:threonylcarbamoyladenosine tRNA methylthiotransferase MtaB|nr:tRNA (N(6)-L-threonylcarbamoyladenosine(37)-C(2))-methylthiotransferase MtaB [Nitrospina sp.]MBT3509812.1 tRNA (N(6)-L-threonylcarbamoyladenosine(37)-C(2))-methylthiotransferase MtaB [Nitrospina sp.]MBT3876212.1 tRNA (N(6)-L-threonylcarbamoyladenosine(37)-C(2))-methylthiotransferase MtaB [Nitrospina sp.]MBT4049810.1 tRNA (N(6)-L-threonylcarbamoyladenosine(37)-C(2))-methylthiotransferase MtaB [Nitrospina sp.]MBT4558708.1 tRNA (N(6)-L-threonylcarbamoyladenosine(37)-C(2))-methylthiotransferase 
MKISCITLGCRTNQHDTAEMQTLLEREGFSIVNGKEKADAYVINTCTVTQRSDTSSRLAVKKSLDINPDALVVFTGCYAQLNPAEASQIHGLDVVLGNADKLDIANLIKKKLLNPDQPWEKEASTEIIMSDIHKKRIFRTIPVQNFQGMTKAFIKVQTGCDERCSFCTVVKARGKSVSDTRENIIQNVEQAVASGFKEITLTGINLGTWGMERNETFSSLVHDIVELSGDFRVRLSSINPMEIDNNLIQLMAETEKLCSHLHIPLQSGDDTILKAMRRNYNRRQYLDVVQRAITAIPGLGLGADVIVGFPDETEEAFENTRSLIEQFPFSYLHVFSYSPRRGTEAYQIKDNVPGNIKKQRNQILTQLVNQKALKYREQFINETEMVLVENQRDTKSGWLKGHTSNYIPVILEGSDSLKNNLVPITLQNISEKQVTGCVQ